MKQYTKELIGYAIAAFIVPYIFALNPAMLFIDTTAGEIVLICITSLIGIPKSYKNWKENQH